MDAFIETLTALPCLQILSLEMYEGSSIQDPAHSSVYGYHTIRLSCLEQLTIADGPQQVTAMIKYLCLPHTVVLNLTCLGYYNDSGVVSYSTFKTDIRDTLSHHFAAANATGKSYADVCFDMHGMNTAGYEIRLSRPCRSSSTEAVAIDGSLSSAAPISPPPFMKLTYLGPVDPYDQQAMSFVSNFIAALPIFSEARTLRVRHTTALRLAIDWERIAGCMPQLKAVSVQRNSAHGLISGMTIEGASSPIFPMLKVIGVEMVDFSEITYGETSFCDGLLAGLSNIGREAPPYLFIQNFELLTMIFAILPSFKPTPWKHLPECFAVSQVSKTWRRVALDFKPLWSSIPLQCVAWMEIALERSRPFPISLDIRSYFNYRDPRYAEATASVSTITPLALYEISRVRELTFELESDTRPHLSDIVKHLNTSPAPELEIFSITSLSGCCFDSGHEIFGRATPMKLRTLDLCDFHIPRNSPLLLAPLTSLRLDNSIQWPTMDSFIETLMALPYLRVLLLVNLEMEPTIQDPTPSSVHCYHSVWLSHLEHLTITDGFQQVTTIMKYLSLPPTAVLDLKCEYFDGELGDVEPDVFVPHPTFKTDIRDALSHHFAAASAAGMSYERVSFGLYGANTAGFELIASHPYRPSSTGDVAVDDQPPPSTMFLPPRMAFAHVWPYEKVNPDDQQAMTFISEVIAALPVISGARIFNVRHTKAFRLAIDWERIAGCMPRLETIRVRRNSAHGLVAGMNIADATSTVFPALKFVEVRMVAFSEFSYDETSFYDGLLAGTSDGRRSAPPIVFIRDCDVSEEMVDELWTKLGGMVKWDGVKDSVTRWRAINGDY
ncbi:hypothetical protein BV25DRAFT_1912947 [Artomyces pyxidatus]|uniref:Uncharacterized protein n=1 Tax=Artomyces pyxidatus TaxID=48021 RepID=A0ACB8TCX6_9AGAM|nr:hypothetical protein BV25DRAFT_1912947 [Artomyces pyxidatus]